MRTASREIEGRRIATAVPVTWSIVSAFAMLTLLSPAHSAPSRCRADLVAEHPVDLLQAFASRMKLGFWVKSHEKGEDALYMSPRTEIRIGIERADTLVRTAAVLTSEMQDSDRTRFQRAATFFLARIANVSEESARGDVVEALVAASNTRQEQSVSRGDAVLLITPVETSGLVARVSRHHADRVGASIRIAAMVLDHAP